MVIIVATNNPTAWGNAKLLLSGYDIVLNIIHTADDNNWEKFIERANYDFIICDNPAAYKKLPKACTVVIFARQPSLALLNFIQSVYLSLSTSRQDIPTCVLWLSDNEKKEIVISALNEFGICAQEGKLTEAQKYMGMQYVYHIVDDAQAFTYLTALADTYKENVCMFLLPTVEAAEALATFVREVVFSYMANDARIKVSKDLGLM